MKKIDICFIFMHLLILSSSIDINNINENSQLKIQLNNNFYLTVPLYINDKEYDLPIDICSDRTLININNNIDNQKNINIILPECKLQDIEKTRKKNTPISFFAKEITLDEIAYEEIDNAFENIECCTKNGIIGLSQKSEKKIFNLLNQLNKIYFLKKSFSIYNNELIIGNFTKEFSDNKYISTELIESRYNWAFNLQGIYFGSINKNNYKNDYFIINKMNSNYIKLNEIVEFNSLQKYIIVNYYYFDLLEEKIFQNKCTIKKNDENIFRGFYCNAKTIETLDDIGLMINDKLLIIPINKLFVKTSSDEYLFVIVHSEYIWERIYGQIGNLFYNELGIKVIFDAENKQIHFLNDKIIEKVKIIDEYDIDDKQILLNNYTFSKYDAVLCIVLILNFLGIFMLLAVLYKEKMIKQLPNNIKNMNKMNE